MLGTNCIVYMEGKYNVRKLSFKCHLPVTPKHSYEITGVTINWEPWEPLLVLLSFYPILEFSVSSVLCLPIHSHDAQMQMLSSKAGRLHFYTMAFFHSYVSFPVFSTVTFHSRCFPFCDDSCNDLLYFAIGAKEGSLCSSGRQLGSAANKVDHPIWPTSNAFRA